MTDLRKSVGNNERARVRRKFRVWRGSALLSSSIRDRHLVRAYSCKSLRAKASRGRNKRPFAAGIAAAPRTPFLEEVVQKRFGLIVCMVCKHDPIGRMVRQRSVTQAAGCEAPGPLLCGLRCSPEPHRAGTPSRAKPNAGFGPGIRLAAQTMMDMTSRDPVAATPGEVVQRVQQNRGIEATGITDKKNRAGLGHLSGKGGRDSPKHGLSESIVP